MDRNMTINDPYQRHDLPDNSHQHQLQVKQQQDHEPLVLLGASSGIANKRRRKSGYHQGNGPNNDCKEKRIIHRDIERQRRQEMAALYRALRLQLPLEYLMGKRSISDHMHEAVKYIKHLKSKIEELSDKRAQLRILSSQSTDDDDGNNQYPESCCSGDQDDIVMVRSCLSGVQVMMSTGCSPSRPGRVRQLTLSQVLEVLVAEGLSVVGCVSTRVNHRLLHTIESEVIVDGEGIDISALQQKLTNIVAVSYSDKL